MSKSCGTLYTIPQQITGYTYIQAVAAFGGLSVDIPTDYVHFESNKKPEFLAKFPHGKIPAFEAKDGFKVFEHQAIALYLASLAPNTTLLGSSPKELALIHQWLSFGNSEILAHGGIISQLLHGIITPYNKPIHTTLAERQLRSLKTLDQHLSTRTFLVSERITIADIYMATVLKGCFKLTFDAALRSELIHCVRFYETIVNQPLLKPIFGETEYIEKAKQYTPPPKEKKEAPKPAEQPKAEKKPKKKEVEEDDFDDDIPKEEPKGKNPLDLLPKSEFNLEDWKRAYSNMDTRGPGGSIEWFYQKFDKEGFSIWRVDFKYNEELTQVFMSSNQVGGFFNRLEASRKYLFGSVGVLGKNNDSIITGVLICRGSDYKPVVNCAPDWESYNFKQIDLSKEDDKKFFEAALAWDLEEGGRKWADGKNFK